MNQQKYSWFFQWVLLIVILSITACTSTESKFTFIFINPVDDSCIPMSSAYSTCAEACEANGLGCATDILAHIKTDSFINRRVLYPGTTDEKPNIQTPMHGLFVPIYTNRSLQVAINAAIDDPFAEPDMPDWSLAVKYNDNPGTAGNADPKNPTWVTLMYKIPGYCPERIFPLEDAPCKGGEWFWFLYRDSFLAFEFDESNDSSVPSWGKAETFCLDCHGAVADADWLWIMHDLVRRQQQLQRPLSNDGHTPGTTGAGFCDSITTLSPDRPQDVLFDPASVPVKGQTMFDCYSWLTFVALHWPAKSGERGVPDTTKTITGTGDRVWETYKQIYEILQPTDAAWSLDDKNWDDPQPLPQVCLDALDDAGISTDGVMTFQVLNETHQAFGNQFNIFVDQNGNIAQYNVRINEDEFEFIKANGYATTGAYSYNGPINPTDVTITLPDNTIGVTGVGATEVKSAWKEMCTDPATCNPVDDTSRYFSRTVLIYTPANVKTVDVFNTSASNIPPSTITIPATCRVATVGLTGMHIIVKTFWAPQWIWATFEHIDNVPGNDSSVTSNFSYHDTSCPTPTADTCLEQRPGVTPGAAQSNPDLNCCENFQIIRNASPHSSNADSASGDLIPTQTTRIDSIQSSAAALNITFRALLETAGSPLQNYVLISTQWAGDGRLSADNENPYGITNKLCLQDDTQPCFTLLPPALRLRNTVIETFQMSYCAPEDDDIGNDPVNCTPTTVVDSPVQNSSGGCMNCHLSSGTDFTFIWSDGVEGLVPLNE